VYGSPAAQSEFLLLPRTRCLTSLKDCIITLGSSITNLSIRHFTFAGFSQINYLLIIRSSSILVWIQCCHCSVAGLVGHFERPAAYRPDPPQMLRGCRFFLWCFWSSTFRCLCCSCCCLKNFSRPRCPDSSCSGLLCCSSCYWRCLASYPPRLPPAAPLHC
jgi:hypothetical protein